MSFTGASLLTESGSSPSSLLVSELASLVNGSSLLSADNVSVTSCSFWISFPTVSFSSPPSFTIIWLPNCCPPIYTSPLAASCKLRPRPLCTLVEDVPAVVTTEESAITVSATAAFCGICRVILDAPELATIIEEAVMKNRRRRLKETTDSRVCRRC